MALATVAASGAGRTGSWITSLTEVSTDQKEAVLGAIRQEGRNWYKYVKYEAGAGAVAGIDGGVTYYDTTAGYVNSLVTMDLSDSIEVGAGVLTSARADAEYGWIQIKGEAAIETDLTGGAVGDPLTPTGATDGTLDVTAAATSAVCAYAVDVTAGAQIIACDFIF